MKKLPIKSSLFLILSLNLSFAYGDEAKTEVVPKKIKLGLYVTQILNLNSNVDTFQADLWLWINYEDEVAEYFELLEFFNSTESKQLIRDTEKVKNGVWDSAKYSNKISTTWDVTNFPFDKQKFSIMVEIGKSTAEIILEPDLKDSGVNPNINLDEWKITRSEVKVESVIYPSMFGSPKRTEPEEYSRFILEIDICRNALSLFFKLHAGVYVAFAITMLSYFMNPGSDDIFSSRISLIVGMLFACLVNMQIVDNTIGKTNSLSLSDKIHIFTMINLFVSICMTIISRKYSGFKNGQWSWKFDRICLLSQIFIYISTNSFVIFLASTSL